MRLKRISISIPATDAFSTTCRCPMPAEREGGRVPTNQSPSCNWKRQRLVRSEDSRLNYRRNTIYWKLSHRRRPCTLDIPPVEGNMLTICKEKRCRLPSLSLSLSLSLSFAPCWRYPVSRSTGPRRDFKCISQSAFA